MSANEYPDFPKVGQVAGGDYQEPGFALLTGAVVSGPSTYITDPSGWRIKWEEPDYVFQSPDASRTRYRYVDRVRFTMLVHFDYIDDDIRETMIGICNHNAGGEADRLVRVWPHKGNTDIYYDCNVEEIELDKYLQETPIGYGDLYLKFVATTTLSARPTYTTPKYYTDRDIEDPGSNYSYYYDSNIEEDDDYKTYYYDRNIQP